MTDDLLGAVPEVPKPKQEEPKRKTPVYPHERKRRARQMSVTFPGPEWGDAIRDQAAAWGMRPSDFVTWAVSQAMAAIESGDVERPQGRPEQHGIPLRAGGTYDLPWEPGE